MKKITAAGATLAPPGDEDVFEIKSKTPKIRGNLSSNLKLPRAKQGESDASTNGHEAFTVKNK